MSNTLMNPCPRWGTFNVIVVAFLSGNDRLEDDGVHQAVGRICFDSHHTLEVVKKHRVGMHPRLTAFHGKLQPGALAVLINVLNVVQH